MSRRPPSDLCIGVSASLLMLGACKTDHDALALEPTVAGSGGRGGSGLPVHPDAAPDGSDAGAVADGATPDGGAVDAGEEDAAASGARWSLTLVHAVTDSTDPVQFCFARVVEGTETRVGVPWPRAGIEYGRSARLDTLDGVNLADDSLRPYVLSGALALIRNLDCEAAIALAVKTEAAPLADAGGVDAEARDAGVGRVPADAAAAGGVDAEARDAGAGRVPADAAAAAESDADVPPVPSVAAMDARPREAAATPPPLRARGLAVLPPGTMLPSRSYLLAAGGCMGGWAFTDPAEESVCGALYEPGRPAVGTYLVAMDPRVRADRVGLQVLNATPAFSPATLRFRPDDQASPNTLAQGVVTGQLAPRAARQTWDRNALQPSNSDSELLLYTRNSSAVAFQATWEEVLAAGGLPSLDNDANYTLILAGPQPGFSEQKWWNGPVLSIVPSAP